jgi:hypothetical protein
VSVRVCVAGALLLVRVEVCACRAPDYNIILFFSILYNII